MGRFVGASLGKLLLLAAAAVVGDAVAESVAASDVKLCPSPGGYHPCDCMHKVDSGTRVDEVVDTSTGHHRAILHFPNGTKQELEECPHKRPGPPKPPKAPLADPCKLNWPHATPFEAFYKHSKDIGSFTATYTVPETPKADQLQTLYYWIGLQDTTSTANPVIQPVLSYIDTWYFESWNCCPAGHKIQADTVPVKGPGELLKGTMERDSAGRYVITSTNSVGNSSVLISNDTSSGIVYTWNWVDIVLETYDVGTCAQYSAGGDASFLNMTLVDVSGAAVTPQWSMAPYIDGQYLPPAESKQFAACCNGTFDLDWPRATMHTNGAGPLQPNVDASGAWVDGDSGTAELLV